MFGVPVSTLASGVAVHHGIEFATVEGFRPLLLDLYVPLPDSASGAAIVYLHGGGWAVGTRRRFGRAFASWAPTPLDLLAQAGFVVATVDYRLSGEARFPAQLHDVKAAIRWLRGAAVQLDLDRARLMAWGESAGGHLALLAGLTGDRPELEGGVGGHLGESSAVCGVVEWYAPTNLLSLSSQHRAGSDKRPDDAGSWESSLVGAPLQSDASRTRAASPISYVHAAAPPIQIHHGTVDAQVPFAQSVELVDALRQAGCPVELIAVDGSDHFWTGAADLEAIFRASLAFAERVTGFGRENGPDHEETEMSSEPLDSATDWVAEHTRKYVDSGGDDGYMWRGYPTVVLTTTGRKSGDLRRNALIFGRDGDDYILIASYGGRPQHPLWYLNLVADPSVTIQERAEVVRGVAETVPEGPDRDRLWDQMVAIYPPYAEYQAKTDRRIQVVRVRAAS